MLTLNTQESQEFLRKLSVLQEKWSGIILENLSIDSQLLADKLKNFEPLYEEINLKFDNHQEVITNILSEIVGLLRLYQPNLQEELRIIHSNKVELYEIILGEDDFALLGWAKDNQVTPLVMIQIIEWVLRPEKMALGQLIISILQGEERNCCPICGESADLAFLHKENGVRNLACSGCQVSWNYPRLKCPTCSNADPENLKYLFVDDAPEQQIHYCEACNTYLKTFDYRFTKEQYNDFLVLNLMTIHLDILAEEKGLRKSCI